VRNASWLGSWKDHYGDSHTCHGGPIPYVINAEVASRNKPAIRCDHCSHVYPVTADQCPKCGLGTQSSAHPPPNPESQAACLHQNITGEHRGRCHLQRLRHLPV
jgi:hypothetical protein